MLPVLYVVQHQMRRQTGSAWVPTVAMDVVAEPGWRCRRSASTRLRTFYLMFNTNPIGRHHLQVCGTTPCWLRGSDEITRACRDVTGIKAWRETSADGMFTMSEVECLGACVNAPILQVNDDYSRGLGLRPDGGAVAGSVAPWRDAVKPGSSIGRMTSAPEGGPTTLTDPGVGSDARRQGPHLHQPIRPA